MNTELTKAVETAISKLNAKPTKYNLNKLKLALKAFSDEYEKQYGYFPSIHIDQFLVGLSGEVITKYGDELPFSHR